MSKYELTDDVGEISGFGGGYEKCCRALLKAGCEWLEAHPAMDPQFTGYKGIYGIIHEENDAAEQLSKLLVDVARPLGGLTGAMHQAVVGHILAVRRFGWDAYCRDLQNTKRQRP